MSHHAPDSAAPPKPADPAPGRPVRHAAGPAIDVTRILVLIRWIISYGTELAATLHQRAAHPHFRYWARRYRNSDIAVIAARIQRGLALAAGLEAKLTNLANQGRNVPVVPCRGPTAGCAGGVERQPRAPARVKFIDLPLDRLPSEEQIADELRRRPVGAVLVDICRDLGLCESDLPGELAAILRDTVIFCGGNLVTLVFAETKPRLMEQTRAILDARKAARTTHAPSPVAASPALGTGPP